MRKLAQLNIPGWCQGPSAAAVHSAVQSRSSDDSALDTRHARSRATHLVVVVLAEVGVVVVVVTRLLERRRNDSG